MSSTYSVEGTLDAVDPTRGTLTVGGRRFRLIDSNYWTRGALSRAHRALLQWVPRVGRRVTAIIEDDAYHNEAWGAHILGARNIRLSPKLPRGKKNPAPQRYFVITQDSEIWGPMSKSQATSRVKLTKEQKAEGRWRKMLTQAEAEKWATESAVPAGHEKAYREAFAHVVGRKDWFIKPHRNPKKRNPVQHVVVVYREYKTAPYKGEILAVFPEMKDHNGYVTVYDREGHNSASQMFIRQSTKPARDEDKIAAVRRKLQGLGYALEEKAPWKAKSNPTYDYEKHDTYILEAGSRNRPLGIVGKYTTLAQAQAARKARGGASFIRKVKGNPAYKASFATDANKSAVRKSLKSAGYVDIRVRGGAKRAPSAYAQFVKEQMPVVRAKGFTAAAAMKEIGKLWRSRGKK